MEVAAVLIEKATKNYKPKIKGAVPFPACVSE
jgi:hypothetical protein